MSSGNLQLVDRTLANGEFNLERDIGLDFRSKDLLGIDKLREYADVFYRQGKRNFGDAVVLDDEGIEVAAEQEIAQRPGLVRDGRRPQRLHCWPPHEDPGRLLRTVRRRRAGPVRPLHARAAAGRVLDGGVAAARMVPR